MEGTGIIGILVGFLPIVFIVGSIVLVFWYVNYTNKKNQENLQKAAKEMGFEFLEEGGNIQNQINSAMQAGGKPLSPGLGKFLNSVLKFVKSWEIRGNVSSGSIRIFEETRGSGKSRHIYTIIDFFPTSPLPFQLEMYRQGFFTTLGIKLFNMQDIIVGDAKFDALLRIVGNDESQVKTYLQDKTRQNAIIELFEKDDYMIFHDKIRYEKMGYMNTTAELKPHIDKIDKAASRFYGSAGGTFF